MEGVIELETPTLPVNDRKQYRRIRLPNGLEALLISDSNGADSGSDTGSDNGSDTDDDEDEDDEDGELHAAVSCAVGVGSFCDPPDSLGCAHFLEHLLFLGQ